MKKQFIAILLTVAMLVAMVPVTVLPANAALANSKTTHTIAFAAPEIIIDGKCDEAYELYNSAPIKSGDYTYKDGKYTGPVDLTFTAYAVASMEGIYLWVDIDGETTFFADNNMKGDYLQFYYNMGNVTTDGTYLPYVLIDYHNKPSAPSGAKTATTKTDNGWTAEIFLPWTPGTPAANAVAEGRTDFFFAWGIQVNDDRDGNKSRDLIAFDSINNAGLSYYRYCSYLSEIKFSDDYKVLEDESGNEGSAGFVGTYGAVYTEQAPSVDGNLEYLYVKGTKISDNHTLGNPPSVGSGLEAYVMATKEGFYVWAKIKDSTFFAGNNNTGDYLQMYYNMSDSATDPSCYGYVQVDYNGMVKVRESTAYGQSNWPSASAAGVKVKTIKNSDHWVAEVFCPWRKNSAAFKAMSEGNYSECFFSLGFQVNDDTDGNKSWNYVYYDTASGGTYYNDKASNFGYSKLPQVGFIYDDGVPTVPIYEKITFAKTLVLGKALQDAKMKYTLKRGETTDVIYADGVKVDEGKYLFYYDIAPQYMGASFTAELVYNDSVFATLAKDYSVLEYYNDLLDKTPNDLGLSQNQYNAMSNFIYDALNYGAVAQEYVGFDTDNLVNKGREWESSFFKGINNYENIEATEALEGYDAEFISMGINIQSANRIYVKFRASADMINDMKVTFSDNKPGVAEQLTIYAVDGEEDTYIAYSPVITPDNYHYQYSFRLVYKDADANNVVIQKAFCNINAYLAEIIADANSTSADVSLAKAVYLYGKSARAYLAS